MMWISKCTRQDVNCQNVHCNIITHHKLINSGHSGKSWLALTLIYKTMPLCLVNRHHLICNSSTFNLQFSKPNDTNYIMISVRTATKKFIFTVQMFRVKVENVHLFQTFSDFQTLLQLLCRISSPWKLHGYYAVWNA